MAVASLAAASLITLGSASASAKDHADFALEFIERATPEGNAWGTPCSINWENFTGTTKAACFFTLALQKSMGYTDVDTYSMWGSSSPTSDKYFDLINLSPALGAPPSDEGETYFRRIRRAVDIRKGDVMAIGATSTYAGHTLIILDEPIELTTQVNPRYLDTKQFAVRIADSTNASHGCNASYADTRWSGECSTGYMEGGAGTGYIRLYAQASTGVLLGYTWSVTSSATSYYSPSTRPYRIGRLFRLPEPQSTELPPPPP
ncbi:hypothetical protein [Sorangium cellulosum]|uniref:hypothetical protein n=1 Tax=Sorangium cellulosum TaxID=56 RepID=UPI001F36F19B|nr:hypothetical protein [Sorangium cellulosum]